MLYIVFPWPYSTSVLPYKRRGFFPESGSELVGGKTRTGFFPRIQNGVYWKEKPHLSFPWKEILHLEKGGSKLREILTPTDNKAKHFNYEKCSKREREQSKLELSGSPPRPNLKAAIKRSSVNKFCGKGMPFKLLWKKPHMAWLLWQTSEILLTNESTVTYNIKTMSAWSYMARSEDE